MSEKQLHLFVENKFMEKDNAFPFFLLFSIFILFYFSFLFFIFIYHESRPLKRFLNCGGGGGGAEAVDARQSRRGPRKFWTAAAGGAGA
jgi:hypothetical protein